MKITLAKALKVKNRLAGKYTEYSQTMQSYNTHGESETGVPSTELAYRNLVAVSNALRELKTAIAVANVPIVSTILELAEFKGRITILKSMPTQGGKVRHFGGTEETRVVQLKTEDVRITLDALEIQVDVLQDKLDAFNASKKIEVSDATMALISQPASGDA